MGLRFTVGLTCIGIFRELLGAGTFFGMQVMPDSYVPFSIFVMSPGAFLVLAFLPLFRTSLSLNQQQTAASLKTKE